MTPDSMNHVFEALAHPVRRKILDVVRNRPACSVNDVCDYFEISRIAVMKHLRALERADLIVSRKEGRTRELFFNAVPIQLIYDRWTTEYSSLWARGLTRIKYRIEAMQPAKRRGQKANKDIARRPENHAVPLQHRPLSQRALADTPDTIFAGEQRKKHA